MEYVEDENCNKTLSDVVNCSVQSSALKLEAIAVPVTFAFIFLLGVTGNALLILNFARHKKLSTAHNALVVNLAAGDLLMLAIGVPFNSLWYTLPSWPFGQLLCKLSRFAETTATAVTIATLAVLSVERFLIVTVRRRHLSQSSLVPVVVVAAVWVIGVLLALPDLMSATVQVAAGSNRTEQAVEFCVDFNPSWGSVYPKANVLCRFLLLFVLPLLVIGPCYAGLAHHLFFRMRSQRGTPTSKTPLRSAAVSMATRGRSVGAGSPGLRRTSFADNESVRAADAEESECLQNNSSNNYIIITTSTSTSTNANASKSKCSSSSNNNTPSSKRRRLAVTVLGLVVAFVVCWLPRHVFLLWFHFDPNQFNDFWHVFKISGFCLMFANSAVNPCVFYILDSHFRAYVHDVVFCKRPPGAGEHGEDCTGRVRGPAGAEDTMADEKNTAYIAMSEMATCTEKVDNV